MCASLFEQWRPKERSDAAQPPLPPMLVRMGVRDRLRHGGELHILRTDGGRAEYNAAVWQAPRHEELLIRRDQYESKVVARVQRASIPETLLILSERWGELDSAAQNSLEFDLNAWAVSAVSKCE